MSEQPPYPSGPEPAQPGPGPQGYGQVPGPGYGQVPPPAWQPIPGQPYGYPQQTHGSATTALVLGICGLVLCPLILSVPAIVIGRNAMKEIDASGGMLGGRGNAKAGFILGIIGTAWGALTVLLVVLVFAIGGVVGNAFQTTCSTSSDGPGSITTTC